ncbi:MAG: gliding motility-associated C-terminal domain-containing protein [Bacteroidales bacterium]|nr:gliding motility-associated C-terminal domain-containing protein [Bacteroidales bacterium]
MRSLIFFRFILSVFLSLQFLFCKSQVYISENTDFCISENGMFATGYPINNFGSISNYGTFEISGDWNNNGIYNELQGAIHLNGNDLQNLRHGNQKIYHLRIYGGEKVVTEDVTITGTLTLSNGIVTPNSNIHFIVDANTQIYSASENSYINGALFHTGTGNKFFPIGKNGHYLPVELINIQGNSPVISLEAFEPNPNPQVGTGIRNVSEERYWRKTLLEGEVTNILVKCESNITPSIDQGSGVVFAQAMEEGGVFSSIGARYLAGALISEKSFSQNIIAFAEMDNIEIVNVITPNSDGINDYLTINNIELYPENEVTILNMIGQAIYSTKNYDNTWDASIDGKILSQGNYMCILKFENNKKIYTQTISILR